MAELTPIGGTPFFTAAPPHGLGAALYADPDGQIIARVTLDSSKEGPPGHVHGGVSAAMLDEVMGATCWYNGHPAVAVNLNYNLKLAVPVDVELLLRARVERVEGRKVFTSAALLLPDGRMAIESKGIFVEAPQYFRDTYDNPFKSI